MLAPRLGAHRIPMEPEGDAVTTLQPDVERTLRQRLQGTDTSSTAEAVFTALSSAIVSRELPPGWRLAEERLAAIFEVSRTPIREALTRLASSGLASRDDRGTLRVQMLTAEKILEVYSVRVALEGLAASLAAQVATSLVVVELEQVNDAYAAAAEHQDFHRMADLNLDFHATIARASRNELLVNFIGQIHTWIRRIPTTTLTFPGRVTTSIDEHRELIAAIGQRDPQRSEEVARKHMRQAEQIRVAMLARGQ